MIAPARLSLRLTPLLDLLLIVIFAQYMDVQQSVEKRERDFRTRLAELERLAGEQRTNAERLRAELRALTGRHDRLVEQNAALAAQRDSLQQLVEQLTDTIKRQSLDLQREADRRRELAGIFKTLFEIPEPVLRAVMERHERPETLRSKRDVQRLIERLQRLRDAEPELVLEHFTVVGELLKRCDLWRLYLAQNGTFLLWAADRTFRFTAETPDEVAEELFRIYKALPEPKSLVIVLLSYGDVRFAVYDAALRGLPRALVRMQADRQGKTRFEYTVMGFDADGPQEMRAP